MREGGTYQKTYFGKEEKGLSIELKQFDGAHVTPKDDATLYGFLEPRNGFITGCEVSFLGGNQIAVASGYGIVGGRLFLIEAETLSIDLSLNGNVSGRLIVKVDLTNLSAPISFIQQSGTTLPELLQEDFSSGGTVFELPVATYTVSSTQLTNFRDVRNVILPENKTVKVNKSGVIDEVLLDGYEYSFESVVSLKLTAGEGHSHGFIKFSTAPTALDIDVDASLGDSPAKAAAGEKWEFDICDRCAFFTCWGVIS